jgi:dTDP-4-amino-4,6-dideoxygalactose transaminase
MHVPYFDLTAQYRTLREEILGALDGVCLRAAFILGDEVAQFETEFAAYCEVGHCVAVNTGTSALHLALLGAGVQPGDEVVTSPNTFIATAEAISYLGARPVFVDVDPATGNIDPERVAAALTARTRAIVPVHLYGRPADIDPLLALAAARGIAVVEDACQAHGARSRGRRAGSIGAAAAFSFYPGKNLGAYGEGGALTTNDADLAQRARVLRHHGETSRYVHTHIGYNYRMDGFQGAVLRIKLRHLDAWTARRRAIARLYREHLAATRVRIPSDRAADDCVYHLFVVWVEHRDAVRAALAARGVETAIHYPQPLHLQAAYAGLGYGPGSFPHAERACAEALSLPLFPEMADEQVLYAARMLAEVAELTQRPSSRP